MKNKLGLVSIASVVVILISFALFAIPGQYIGVVGYSSDVQGTSLAGYEYIFYIIREIAPKVENHYFSNGRASVTGIIALVFMLLSGASFWFYKKSTALPLLGSILNIISGFFILMTTPFSHLIYKKTDLAAKWVPYVSGSFILLLGIIGLIVSIVELKKEKVVLESKGGYSYLKK